MTKIVKENGDIVTVVEPCRPDIKSISDMRKFEREELGLNYKTLDELTDAQKNEVLASALPVKKALAEVVAKMPFEGLGVAGLKDTTKFDGNLAEQYKNEK